MSSRSEALAARIEEGAKGLAAFAQGLSDAEWKTRVPGGSGRDSRPVGVAVHHVASVYPVEIDLARGIAAGNAVDVGWDAVAEMNAKHAQDNANVSKADAIALLNKNSKAAADAVRTFTDAQLDTAAPFGLSFGAPVTAQFVLEDHAVRHSWHHLARIRSALGK